MKYSVIFILLFLMAPLHIFAQYEKYLLKDPEPKVYKQGGVAFSVVELGTGLGVFYSVPLKNFWHAGLATDFFLLRDENQIDIIDPWTGIPVTINKENNAYVLDMMFSFKKRLLARKIDDSLRPFVAAGAGPMYGINFPLDKKKKDEYRWAWSVFGAAGVDIALESMYFLGLRLQYRVIKFQKPFTGRKDHSTFDIRLEIGKFL